MNDGRIRCPWTLASGYETRYHDEEWGVPCLDDAGQFEFLVLESAQAGLSWLTILNKREGYRRCFANFDPEKVTRFTENDVKRLLADPGIIRNRKKIESTIKNARLFLELAGKHGSFSKYIWSFVGDRPIKNAWKKTEDVPVFTPVAEKMSKEMKKMGFGFLGPTVLYAHMQATGMVNDHLVSCYRHAEINAMTF
jgi:DNA-3-methyladenine glycosylase I